MRPLTVREAWFVLAGLGAVLLFAAWIAIVAPYRGALERAEKRVESRRQQLVRLVALGPEVARLRQAVNTARSREGSATPLAAVEGAAEQAGIRDRLTALRPVETGGGQGVEATLEKVRLDQAVRWLFFLEQGSGPLEITQLRLRPRFEESSLLDVSATLRAIAEAKL